MSSVAPDLPNGFVVIVKRECATCQMVEPVLSHIASATNSLTVYTQDDPTFPSSVSPIHDEDLSVSWHYDIDTVPTLIKVVNGKEVERTFGWKATDWQRITGIADLGADLPAMRPGCGSMSVDPDIVDKLRAKFTDSPVIARTLNFLLQKMNLKPCTRADGQMVCLSFPQHASVCCACSLVQRATHKTSLQLRRQTLWNSPLKKSQSTQSWLVAFPNTCRGSSLLLKQCVTTNSICTECWPPQCLSAPSSSVMAQVHAPSE
jgi:thiol-disulfide isomerase/thioredoxin